MGDLAGREGAEHELRLTDPTLMDEGSTFWEKYTADQDRIYQEGSKVTEWVQCEHAECMKWRVSPPGVDLPDPFYCHHIPGLDCNVAEDKFDAQTESVTMANYELPDLTEGTDIDCYFSRHSMWHKATILQADSTEQKIRVKYHLPGAFEEWIDIADKECVHERIAALNFRTQTVKRPPRRCTKSPKKLES